MKNRFAMAKRPGQGIIEYAGAMVVVSVLVGTVISVSPSGIGNMYSHIYDGVQVFLTSGLGSL